MAAISELKSSAKVIDVERDEAEIFEEFKVLLTRESRLSSLSNLTCDLKWTADGGRRNPCDSCEHYQARPTADNALAVLCRLGRQQNALIDEMDAVKAAEKLDEALMAAYEADSAYVGDLVAALD